MALSNGDVAKFLTTTIAYIRKNPWLQLSTKPFQNSKPKHM
ncbi:hypothetical protein ENHYDAX1_130029 [Enhydrobacter sp. AX1]|nr:hypothetical protein ENHYDAX1_130029 [Enhydrobacter sp. AX1]